LKAHIKVLDSVRNTAIVSVLPTRRIKPVNHLHLKTRQLALLVRLDEERGLARAAAAAGLTQPAASKMLRQIESDLDVKLFDRHARGMAPTRYGEILIRHARRALSELGLASDEIVALKSGLSGKAAIGTALSPGTNLVPLAVLRLKQRHPDVITRVEILSGKTLVQELVRGELDMVVGRALDSAPGDELLYEPLAPGEPYAVIASAEHPLGRRRDLQLAQLVELPWILPPAGSVLRQRITEMLLQRGLSAPSNIVEADCLPMITSLLLHSDMLAVLPEGVVQAYCKGGILTVLARNLNLEMGAFGLITRRGHDLSPAAQLMVDALREQARLMYPAESSKPACARMSVV
jgi:DNA-binding transcriptional LysR family regulator